MNVQNYLFLHIPKTGGTSIKSCFKEMPRDKLHHSRIPPGGVEEVIHEKSAEHAYKFAFVRNVWDRHVSNYIHFKSITRDHWLYKYDSRTAEEVQSFDNFKEFCFEFKNIYSKFHFDSQYKWVYDRTGKIMLNFVGKYERLQQDFNVLCDNLNIGKYYKILPQQLPVKNRHIHKHYTEYYDDETKQIVAEKYAKDIELFGYKFGD